MRKLCPFHFLVLFCLLLACSAVAAFASSYDDVVYPLMFSGYTKNDTTAQMEKWNKLIKYKLFATGDESIAQSEGFGVVFKGQSIFITDSIGYTGSPRGNLVFKNTFHVLGGPILFGGKFMGDDGYDTLLTGPTRFKSEFVPKNNSAYQNWFAGKYCFDAGYNQDYTEDGLNDAGGVVLDASLCASDALVPYVDSDLDVPVFDSEGFGTDGHSAVIEKIGNILYLHVPPSSAGETFNVVMNNIHLDNNEKLYVLMPPGGRMTKIFLQQFTGIGKTDNTDIIVAEATSTGLWDNASQKWDVSRAEYVKLITNSNYAGNLLFHVAGDLTMSASEKNMQGTYISTGNITFAQNTHFAGQLLAKNIYIDAFFDAKDFRYVPFNPPKLTVKGDVYEDNAVNGDTLRITLNKIPPTKVTFKYCFNVKKITDCPSVSINDASYCSDAIVEDFQKTNFPICGDTTFEAFFNQGDSVLATPIVVHAVDDNLTEDDEDFSLVISDLSAAVYVDGDRYIDDEYRSPVSLIDNDAAPLSRDTTVIARVNEKLSIVKFPALLADGTNSLLNYTVYIESVPAKGTLTYNGTIVNVGDSFDADPATGLIKGLEFQPATGDFGAGYAGIEFTVSRIGNPVARSEKYTMTIDVVNISFEIEENTIAGTPVGNVEDLNISGNLSCSILNGNTGNAFAMGIGSEIDVNGKLDFETLSSYSLLIKCDNGTEVDSSVVSVIIIDVNEPPAVRDTVLRVAENEPAGTVVGTIPLYEEDRVPEFLQDRFSIIDGPKDKYAIDSVTGTITTKISLDYEEKMFDTLLVLVKDQDGNRDSATVIIAIGDVTETSTIIVTEVEVPKSDTSWTFPKDTIFVNRTEIILSWDADGKPQPDTTIKNMHEGYNPVTLKYYDKTKNKGVEKTIYIFVCTRTPQADIAATVDTKPVENIYTIVESVPASDTAYYVNKEKNDIKVTIREPILDATYTAETCQYKTTNKTINVAFDTLAVDSSVFKTMRSIMKEGIVLDLSPKSKVSSANANDSLDLHSYKTTVKGKEVTISYYTNSKGDVVKNKDGVEVMKVSYETVSRTGSKIVVSYEADAVTGEVIKQWEGAEFMVSYPYKSNGGEAMEVSYFTNSKGTIVKNEEGNIGYSVRYTYTDAVFGNTCSRSIIVVVDMIAPVVEIVSPEDRSKIHANFVEVVWTVDGNPQDSLKMQALLDKSESIVRIYRDKAGNESSAYVVVTVKKPKDIDINVEKPVTIVNRENIEEYYADNEPERGETYAISFLNYSKDREEEVFVGGSFKMKDGSGETPYPGMEGHLGPTLAVDVKLPMVTAVGGLATLDDIMIGSMVALDGVDAKDSKKVSVNDFVRDNCVDDFVVGDYTRNNLYETTVSVHIWIYTNLGQFVDEYSYKMDLNDPDYVSKAGMLTMFFELKPDANGYVRTKDGRLLASGAYVYKTEVMMRSKLLCNLPPIKESGMPASNVKGAIRKVSDDMLRPFGYKRPADKE